jgi:hypothetical protein
MYLFTYTIVDRQGRILVSAVENVIDAEHADQLIQAAMSKLTACDYIVEQYNLKVADAEKDDT